MRKNKKPHPAACPCETCRKVVEEANSRLDDTVLDTSKNSRLKKLSPEAAKTLGYIPANPR